jgi:hypothetical protein
MQRRGTRRLERLYRLHYDIGNAVHVWDDLKVLNYTTYYLRHGRSHVHTVTFPHFYGNLDRLHAGEHSSDDQLWSIFMDMSLAPPQITNMNRLITLKHLREQ